jgi:site-specific recombinase XerD
MRPTVSKPKHLCWQVQDWPAADRAAWTEMLTPGDILEPGGDAAHWAPDTVHKNRRGYGRWLCFLAEEDPVSLEFEPAARVTRVAVRAYLEALRQNDPSPYTVLGRLGELHDVIKAMAPERDWRWLRTTINRLRRQARPRGDKAAKVHSSVRLVEAGLQLMAEADVMISTSPILRATRYRDGLMLALLALRPLRLRNLAMIEIDRHLVQQNGAWWLLFRAEETKTGEPIEVPVPEVLEAHLWHYLEVHRPALLQGRISQRLWINQYGDAMGDQGLYRRITKVTKRCFGVAINPHLFRHCAATTIAIEDPKHVGIAKSLLGHSSLATSEAHYNQARALEAGRTYHAHVRELRRGSRPPRQR